MKYEGKGGGGGCQIDPHPQKMPSLVRVRTKNKLGQYKRVCENKDFCNAKILAFNQYQKSVKAPFIIYADLECIIERIDGYNNNPEKSSTRKVSEHIPSGFFNVYNVFIKKYRK